MGVFNERQRSIWFTDNRRKKRIAGVMINNDNFRIGGDDYFLGFMDLSWNGRTVHMDNMPILSKIRKEVRDINDKYIAKKIDMDTLWGEVINAIKGLNLSNYGIDYEILNIG